MSYCRWSSDDFASDVYVYESVDGVEILVASTRYVCDEPMPPPTGTREDWVERHEAVIAIIRHAKLQPIGLPCDGKSYKLSHRAAAEKLRELSAMGYHVPEGVVESLLAEANEGGGMSTLDPIRVAARVDAREQAKDVFSLLAWPDGYGADFADALCDELRNLLPKRREPETKPEAPIPLARLAANQMPFGNYYGKSFDEVPLDYLDWLCRSQEEFYKTLRAYLTHPDLERRE